MSWSTQDHCAEFLKLVARLLDAGPELPDAVAVVAGAAVGAVSTLCYRWLCSRCSCSCCRCSFRCCSRVRRPAPARASTASCGSARSRSRATTCPGSGTSTALRRLSETGPDRTRRTPLRPGVDSHHITQLFFLLYRLGFSSEHISLLSLNIFSFKFLYRFLFIVLLKYRSLILLFIKQFYIKFSSVLFIYSFVLTMLVHFRLFC